MTWRVAYWEGRVVFRASDAYAWGDLPTEGVLWVDVQCGEYHHDLAGMDNYWVVGDTFGVFNDPENWDQYGGREPSVYRLTPTGSVRLPGVTPPHAHVLHGVLVPDDVWARVRSER